MPLEIKLLVWSAALAFVQSMVAVLGTIGEVGLPTAAGNRDNMMSPGGWAGRANRAHRNLLESLVLFAILILAAQALGKLNAMTTLGAQLYFYARVVYAVVYIIGIPWLRTIVWGVSIAGLVILFLQLVQ